MFDARTGLIWQRCGDGQSWDASAQTCAGTAKRCEWLTAMDRAKVLSAGTSQKWRLPSLKEMSRIVDEARSHPAMDPVVFPATPTTSFWVSNHSSSLLGEPWLHGSGDGDIDTSSATFKYAVRFVRDALRGGPRRAADPEREGGGILSASRDTGDSVGVPPYNAEQRKGGPDRLNLAPTAGGVGVAAGPRRLRESL